MRSIGMLALGFGLVCGVSLSCRTGGEMRRDLVTGPWMNLVEATNAPALRGFRQENFPEGSWTVSNGVLRAVAGAERVDLVTRHQFRDFEMEYEWKVAPGANSGVMYRVSEQSDAPWHTGPEMQILDDAGHADGASPLTAAGSLYALIAREPDVRLKPVGRWNTARIVFSDNEVEHWLNGRLAVRYRWQSPAVNALIEESKFSDLEGFMAEPVGHIDLQHHGDDVWFRNVRVRRIVAGDDR